MISNTTTEKMYQDLGISREVYSFCQEILTGLEPRFKEIDENAEYNQLKVIKAMQDNKVSEACLLGTTGYGGMSDSFPDHLRNSCTGTGIDE